MDADSRMWIGIIIAVFFLILKGFITACETAVVEVNDSKVKKLAKTDKRAKTLEKLIATPNKLLTSISVLKAINSVIITLIVTVTFYVKIKKIFQTYGLIDTLSSILSILVLVLITTLLLSTFGDSIPKAIAKGHIEKFPFLISGALKTLVIFITPFEKIISAVTFVFKRLMGISVSDKKGAVTEEEILMMVDAVNETGVIGESQKEMINNIFEFGDIVVSDVMTHRTDIVAVEKETGIKELTVLAVDKGFSRIPVYDDSIDNIIGAVYVKDLLPLVGKEDLENYKITQFMRDIKYIPQTNNCGEIFKEFTSSKVQIAVVVDEYGGTAGIVTMEDLIEVIVGNIQDEYDNETEEIVKLSDDLFEVSGIAVAREVFEELSLEISKENDYDTIGGLVIDLLGYIPTKNEQPSVDYKNVTFTVLQTEENRIVKLRVKINNNMKDTM